MRKFFIPAAVLLAIASGYSPVSAQDDTARVVVDTTRTGTGWNAPRVLDMISRAATRRAQPQADTSLHNYRATAEGFVYFFLDRRANDERTLMRVNQIGLELYWKQPGIARQRIAGMRDASPLPNTMRYHIDHLTMVQNGFGDVIRMGDGDEVRDVMHPASATGRNVYEYRLSDSLEIALPGISSPIRVYEVQVRPRRADRPGFVGSIYVDRGTSDIIRMTFTFTPSSYVDKRLDYINLSLDNGLWEGRYWLPNEQTVEIRRQLPELDFVAGSVIRGRMRITDYELNAIIPDSIFRQPRPVVAASPEALAAYEYESGLFDDLADAGLAQPPEMAELRREAAALIGARFMSGLPALRIYYRDVSSAIRYNRAEGLFLGAGLTYAAGPPWRYDLTTGYAFASERPSALARVTYAPAASSLSLTAYTRELRDIGPITSVPGVINSLSSLLVGNDYLDPWYASGAGLALARPIGDGYEMSLTATAERHRNADRVIEYGLFDRSSPFRDITPILPVDDYGVTGVLKRPMPSSGERAWGGSLSVKAAHYITQKAPGVADSKATYIRPLLHFDGIIRPASKQHEVRASFTAAASTEQTSPQYYFRIGGVGTLPGYGYRAFAGRSGALARIEATQRVLYPWLGIRGIAAAGATNGGPFLTTSGIKTSAGAGLSLFWDILHVDAIKGLNGGTWVVNLSFTRMLDDIS